jgi:hypothetical protein
VNVRIRRRLLGLFLGDIVDRIVNERSQENAARSSTTRLSTKHTRRPDPVAPRRLT